MTSNAETSPPGTAFNLRGPRIAAVGTNPVCRERGGISSTSSSVVSTSQEVITELAAAHVSAVCWLRNLPPQVATACDALARTDLDELDVINRPSRLPLERAASPFVGAVNAWMLRDFERAVSFVAEVGKARTLRFVFGTVATDKCRKFHCDSLRYRLVTTYAGPGTEWLADEDVDREALARLLPCAETSNRLVVREPTAVNRALAGDVLLMKGAMHDGVEGTVHRSPPIEGTRERRLLLAISTVD